MNTKQASISSEPVTYEELRSRFSGIFQSISDGAVQREQNRELAYTAVNLLRDSGFGALRVPVSYGGAGASLPQLFRLVTDLAKADSNLAQIFRAHFSFVEGRLSLGDPDDQEYWFSKVVAGELWAAAMAERTDTSSFSVELLPADPRHPNDDFILHGTKYYSTGSLYADWTTVFAISGEESASIVVPINSPGLTCEDDWDGFGQRLTGSGTTHFNRVRIDKKHILRRRPGRAAGNKSIIATFHQLFHLATLAGICKAVLCDATLFVKSRTRTYGEPGHSSPKDDPVVQRIIGRLSSLAYSSWSLVMGAAEILEKVHQAELQNCIDESYYVEAEIRTYQAQQIVIEQVLEATTLLFEVGGASATSNTRLFDRHWRNARTIASHNPTIYRERNVGSYYLNDCYDEHIMV
ncbi:acyl-CoA dehydrogenase family protein [Pseudomonas sp. RIT-To-2]|uniref:acyl-CoA dehydrogenase family protein n=1 Tax=Pseudomonas sp. RIT-To-2 TaxID=3462541 RepID=UPI00241370A5